MSDQMPVLMGMDLMGVPDTFRVRASFGFRFGCRVLRLQVPQNLHCPPNLLPRARRLALDCKIPAIPTVFQAAEYRRKTTRPAPQRHFQTARSPRLARRVGRANVHDVRTEPLDRV